MGDATATAAGRERAMRAAATAALRYVEPGTLLGVGSGRTVVAFIEVLAGTDRRPSAAVASFVASASTPSRCRLPAVFRSTWTAPTPPTGACA
jgi:ribose 5-phosphate isomerase